MSKQGEPLFFMQFSSGAKLCNLVPSSLILQVIAYRGKNWRRCNTFIKIIMTLKVSFNKSITNLIIKMLAREVSRESAQASSMLADFNRSYLYSNPAALTALALFRSSLCISFLAACLARIASSNWSLVACFLRYAIPMFF